MDTKRNNSVGALQQAAFNAKKVIDAWKPDIVVTSDDNAAKYLVAPYYKNTSIPFVFCGLNWDASLYGLPASNVTGMVEITPLLETIDLLKRYADGNRIGYIGADDYSNRKAVSFHKHVLNINYTDGRFVSTFNEWKKAYLKMQTSVDMLICLNPLTVKGWNNRKAKEFILANTKVPS